jgi:F-type H+-transporting ATPase subunit epsilon
MAYFGLEILSPEGTLYEGEVASVSIPTTSGIIMVLPGHANLVTILKRGDIVVTTKNGYEQKITVTGGFVEISEHRVNIAAQFAVQSDESNQKKIEQALQFAQELKRKKQDSIDLTSVESRLKKEISNLNSGIRIKRKY